MKFLATATRSTRNPLTGRVTQVVKGNFYTKSQVKPWLKDGVAPNFLVDGNLSHFERFVQGRSAFLDANSFESDTYYAVCKGIVHFFDGDTKALRKFGLGGGTAQMAMKLEREFAEALGIAFVPWVHEADDPLAHAKREYPGFWPCSKQQEDTVIALTIKYLSERYM
jgi:hypothetical protein